MRGFAPETGKPLYTIESAHGGGVTALASYTDCQNVITGGKEGGVRVWHIEKKYLPHKNEFRLFLANIFLRLSTLNIFFITH